MSCLQHRKDDTQPWKGRYYPYDLVKELCIAVGVIGLLAVVLTVLFSSPDDKPSTIAQWSRELPVELRRPTAATELDGTSGTATYGPPYNHNGEGSMRGSSSRRNGSASATRSTPNRTSWSSRWKRSPTTPR